MKGGLFLLMNCSITFDVSDEEFIDYVCSCDFFIREISVEVFKMIEKDRKMSDN